MTLYLTFLMVIGSLVGVVLVARRVWGTAPNPQIDGHIERSVREPVDSFARVAGLSSSRR